MSRYKYARKVHELGLVYDNYGNGTPVLFDTVPAARRAFEVGRHAALEGILKFEREHSRAPIEDFEYYVGDLPELVDPREADPEFVIEFVGESVDDW
jgi:hypothetical protein